MFKTAYAHGIRAALQDVGLWKQADEDVETKDPSAQAQNPAEQLAKILQEGNPATTKPAPDNHTKKDKQDTHEVNWGKETAGSGGDQLSRMAPGFTMPHSTSV